MSSLRTEEDMANDPRYPRPLWFRIFRFLFSYWAIIPIILGLIYLIAFIVTTIHSNGGFLSLFSPAILHDLLLDPIVWLVTNHQWLWIISIIIGIIIVVIIYGSLAIVAADDDTEEFIVLNLRERNEQESHYPPGFTLRSVLHDNNKPIQWIRWLLDGKTLAICDSATISLWNSETGEVEESVTRIHLTFYSLGTSTSWPSPNGKIYILKEIADNGSLRLSVINVSDESVLSVFPVIADGVMSIAWSPDQQTIAFADDNGMLSLLKTKDGERIKQFASSVKEGATSSIARYHQPEPILVWSPDGTRIASSYRDVIKLWDVQKEEEIRSFVDSAYDDSVYVGFTTRIAWSPDGTTLLTAPSSNIIQLWNTYTGKLVGSLENSGDFNFEVPLSFSSDGTLLASKYEKAVQLWRCDTWELVATLNESSRYEYPDIIFHPTNPSILATFGKDTKVVRIWDLDLSILLGDKVPSLSASATSLPSAEAIVVATREENSASSSHVQKAVESYEPLIFRPQPLIPARYTNAKVVLVGDSGVGKSGLGLVLTNNSFRATESTHGRFVWMFESKEVEIAHGRKETRETLLWDLAGQSGYRLVHQLHLHEVTVALVVFDARNETDPFSGVRYWCRALDLAQSLQGSAALPMKKFLVAARADRGSVGVSSERINTVMRELGFAHFFETSAKEGLQIAELAEAIRAAVDWKALPWTQSTQLFQRIKGFLVTEKEAKRILSRTEDLYRAFLHTQEIPLDSDEMRLQFETCVRQVEANGLIRRLSFGNLVLLQPEFFDAYASSLINAAKQEVDGLGNISEAKVLAGNFSIPADERIKDREQEKLLLIALVEDLLRYDIVLREQAEDGAYLVFPSQSTRENRELPNPEGRAVTFTFDGPILNIYTTLAVRMAHSALFKKREIWKNAITYTASVRGTCGMYLQNDGEGAGELTLFFDRYSSEETRFLFERYIQMHLQQRSLPNTMQRRRIFICPNPECAEPLTDSQAKRLRGINRTSVNCLICDTAISLLDGDERLNAPHSSSSVARNVQVMDNAANRQRELEANKSTVLGKRATRDFDVFLCHNGKDKLAVKEIGEKLKTLGILPWLDEWELRPGLPWQQELERQIEHIKAAAVFIGKDGIGPWQDTELRSFLSQFQKRKCPVIPVILPQCEHDPAIPLFLKEMTWVDFRKKEPDPIGYLVWGITGARPY